MIKKYFLLFVFYMQVLFLSAQPFYNVIRSWSYGSPDCSWRSIACGDVDGDGIDEFAALRSDTSQLIVFSSPNYYKGATPEIKGIMNLIDTLQDDFIGMAMGKFIDLGDNSEQIAVLRNVSDGISPSILLYWQLNYYDFQMAGAYYIDGQHQWVGCASGDIDADGLDEFVVCKKDTVQFEAFDISSSGIFSSKGGIIIPGCFSCSENDWRGLTCGDLNHDGKDEVLGVRNSNPDHKDINIWVYDSGSFSLLKSYRDDDGSAENDWLGAASGNFDGITDNGDEFVLYRNSSPFLKYYHYDQKTNSIRVIGKNDYGSNTSNPWFIAGGNTNRTNTRDELMTLRSSLTSDPVNIEMIGDKFWAAYGQADIPGIRDSAYNIIPDAAEQFLKDNGIQTLVFVISDWYILHALGAPSGDPVADTTVMGFEYANFMRFLEGTKNSEIKVWLTLIPQNEAYGLSNCDSVPVSVPSRASYPSNTGLLKDTTGNIIYERDYFSKIKDTCTHGMIPDPLDLVAWFKICNLLARQYPNFVGLVIDDFGNNLFHFWQQLPAMYDCLDHSRISFIPLVYYHNVTFSQHCYWTQYADGMIYAFNSESSPAPDCVQGSCSYDNSTTSTYLPEMNTTKEWWNCPDKPIYTLVFVSPLSCLVANECLLPVPAYVDTLMHQSMKYSDGVYMYCTQNPNDTSGLGSTVYCNFSAWANLPYDCNGIFTSVNSSDHSPDALLIYPNPADEYINIHLDSYHNKVLTSIYDIHGKLIKVSSSVGSESFIDISDFSKGMYFIKVETIDNICIQKFLKN